MEIETPKKGRINQGLIVFTGLSVLVLAVITFFFILRGVYGSFGIKEMFPNSKTFQTMFAGGAPKVAILNSQYTQNMMPEGSTWVKDNLTSWQKTLSGLKLKYNIISDQDVELGKHFEYEIIILPGSKSLSNREIIQLKKYMDQGGSVFATSGTASYSDDGKWRGWEFFSEVYGIRFNKEIEATEGTKIHTLRGSLPLTSNIPAGYPLKVSTWDRPIAAEVLDPRTVQVSYWFNYKMQDGLVREEIQKSAGIVYGTYGAGRFIWMGFEINSVLGVQEDYIFFDRLFRNSINWLSYKPLAFVADWPENYSAAAIITPNLSQETDNVNELVSLLSSEKTKATFFIDPYLAEQKRDLIKRISESNEIGALIDLGFKESISDTINKLFDYKTQLTRLSEGKKRIEKIVNSKVNGALPLFGLYDQNSINSIVDAGLSYIFTDSLNDRAVPRVHIRGDKRITSITKTARDDYEIIRDFNLVSPDFQFYTYQEDIDRVLFESGLYIFKIHPEYQCLPDNINVIRRVIKDIREKNIWLTTADEVSKWYIKRDQIELRVEKRGALRVAITVTNPGKDLFRTLKVNVDLNDKAESINLTSEIIGTKPAKLFLDKTNNQVYMIIPDLKPGESRTYYMDYTRLNT